MHFILVLLVACVPMVVSAQTAAYFVSFRDKAGTPYRLDAPHHYLSERSVERRIRQQIAIDSTDLPVNSAYVNQLINLGVRVKYTSRWMNGAIVLVGSSTNLAAIQALSFVRKTEEIKPSVSVRSSIVKEPVQPRAQVGQLAVAATNLQLSQVNGHHLHTAGFLGKGMHIAVLDAGFYRVNQVGALQQLWDDARILGTFDFVEDGTPFFETNNHGLHVLSILAGKVDNGFTGSAPEASFWLMRTEAVDSEFPIEADYWVCAAEKADSLGADVIQSSLGYFSFDVPVFNYSYALTNGSTRISRAATLAVNKGMAVVNSAGNEGNNSWRYIIMPADAHGVLAVGAVNADSLIAPFSSVGPTFDKRVKPDVVAMGKGTYYINQNNAIASGDGTSYSTPVVSGLLACLWQVNPKLKASELINLIVRSSSRYGSPSPEYGYGLPDFRALYNVVSGVVFPEAKAGGWALNPNPVHNFPVQLVRSGFEGTIALSLWSLQGKLIWSEKTWVNGAVSWNPLVALQPGIYLVRISDARQTVTLKLVKE